MSELDILRRLVEGTAGTTGEEFFQSLVRNLGLALESKYAFIAEFADAPTRVRTIALWGRGALLENVEYDLAGTPCEEVARGETCLHPSGVQQRFPEDRMLVDMGVESYLGVPLVDEAGRVVGHMAVLDEQPMAEEARRISILRIFAARAAAELGRVRMQRELVESERRLRDLFDEAPIGYVYEDTNTRFVSANQAFMRMLGIRHDEVTRTFGRSLVAPESMASVEDSLRAEQAGQEKPYIEIELRRKDNGQSVWIQRYSRPEPDGKHTRTMVVDITARVLAERERARLSQQNAYLREEIQSEYNFEEIIGGSAGLRASLAAVAQVAPTDATVLILGETGTGKELITRALHSNSLRKDKALIKINCAALPTGLVESELFGHERGAFTGATEKRVGRFALADGGTIFLDEIGDISPEVQQRLLRVLQEQEFEPLGSSRTIKVNVRVIAATNRDLTRAVADGSFRADLFYRLNVFPISVPPLRERREDIPLLVHFFVNKYATKMGRRIDAVHAETMERLARYPWPGNIRELQNVVERAVILATGAVLEVDPQVLSVATEASDTGAGVAPAPSAGDARADQIGTTLDEVERRHIVETLQRCHWVVDGNDGAAKLLGLNPSTLRSRMKKFGIRRANQAAASR